MANQLMQLDHVFGALSDATRRAIVMRLCDGEASVGELAKPFEMALPSLMKHIRILESSGLVASEERARQDVFIADGSSRNHRSLVGGSKGNLGATTGSTGNVR